MSPVAPISENTLLICIFCIFLVPLATAGLALVYTGFNRSRNAAHTILSAMCILAVSALAYAFCGFSLQGVAGDPGHSLHLAGKNWNWIATEPLFMRGLALDSSSASLAALLQVFSVGLACLIPLGSGSGRWRLAGICGSTAVLAGIIYPLFAHWAWGGGWLGQLGQNYGLGIGFVDVGGSGTIQAVGGLTALAVAWFLGPRNGKFSLDGMPAAIPAHNAIQILFGSLLALPGWIGLNCAGAILFYGQTGGQLLLIAINTLLAAGTAALATTTVTRFRFTRPDASLCANGWLGGLVASSASCAFVRPIVAVVIGIVAGVLVPLTVELLELRMGIDDPGGAISVHAVGGIWGLLAMGLMGRTVGVPGVLNQTIGGQFLAQLVGIATLVGFVLPASYLLNAGLNRFLPLRANAEDERQGMDLGELGAGAYPEFLTYRDEFTQR